LQAANNTFNVQPSTSSETVMVTAMGHFMAFFFNFQSPVQEPCPP